MGSINLGNADRAARFFVGLVLVGLSLAGAIGMWGWIGLVPMLTAVFSSCPLYTLLGMSTCPVVVGGNTA